jgi:hypothetical protein
MYLVSLQLLQVWHLLVSMKLQGLALKGPRVMVTASRVLVRFSQSRIQIIDLVPQNLTRPREFLP